jgi:uncharacterized protein (DUF2147 family)
MMLVTLLLAATTPSAAAGFEGRWHTPGNRSVVDISRCGAQYCGRIVSVVPRPGTNTPPLDVQNPDPSRRTRPLVGLQLLSGFASDGSGGTIYNPQNGRTYRSSIRLDRDGSLRVSGCVAVFCQSQRWVRVR